MAAGIEKTDAFGEVRSNGKKAWHGLGMAIPDRKTAREAFPLIGLDWEEELVTPYCDLITPDGVMRIEAAEYRVHVRRDTKAVLGIVGKDYKPIHNMELAEFADGLAGADAAAIVETAGSLHNGKRIFCFVRLPRVIYATDEDAIQTYVAVTNGHGGFAGWNCYPTSVRGVCANTLRMSEADLHRGLQFQHTGNIEQKLKTARIVLGLAYEETKKFEAKVKALVGRKLRRDGMKSFLENVWEETFCAIPAEEDGKKEDAREKLIAKRDALVAIWIENIEKETAKLPSIRGTAWAALNGVTFWHDHQRGHFKDVSESDVRQSSNLFGVSHREKQIALRAAMELV